MTDRTLRDRIEALTEDMARIRAQHADAWNATIAEALRILDAHTAQPAPEWHLSRILSYICTDPASLRGLPDDATMRMEISIRVGDVREAHKALVTTIGSADTEARWIADTENACRFCGGSGHKDDVAQRAPDAVAEAREMLAALSRKLDHLQKSSGEADE